MAVLPDMITGVSPRHPLQEAMEWQTLVSSYDNGEESRKQKQLFVRRPLTLRYKNKPKDEGRTLWRFFQDRKGRFKAFSIFLPWEDVYAGEYVGTGDGSRVGFNIPSRNATSVVVYVDGTEQTGGGTDYTFTKEGGADGADLIEFSTAPATGAHITMDFSGILKIRSRFDEDTMEWETFFDKFVTVGIKTKGLLNA